MVGLCLAVAVGARDVSGQERLEPELGILAEGKESYEYHTKIRHAFAEAYGDDVVLRVVILPSFEPEKAVGVRKIGDVYRVFSFTSSSAISEIESLRAYESGRITTFDQDGKQIPPAENETYLELKRRTPDDYRKIKVQQRSANIPESLSLRIAGVWEKMLLDARHPKNPPIVLDGTGYHFSMRIAGHGVVGAQVRSPNDGTKTAKLVDLARTLAQYSTKQVDEKRLVEALKPLE